MTASPSLHTAVLMGDIVESRNRHSPERLHMLFNQVIASANEIGQADILSPLTITLGDEFQGLIRSLTAGAAIARHLRLELLREGIDCRFVVGQARLQTPINTSAAWNMFGEGLPRARAKLNEKQVGAFYRFVLLDAPGSEGILDALGLALSSIESDWTAIQVETVAQALAGHSVDEVAALRSVTARNIYKSLKIAKFEVYTTLWNALLSELKKFEVP